MRSIAHVSAVDIRLHAAKKRAVTDIGPSRPSKRSQGDIESVPTRVSDIPLVIAPDIEPVIVLSASTTLPPIEVLSVEVEMVTNEDAAPEPSMAPSTGVRAESLAEPKLSTTAQAIP